MIVNIESGAGAGPPQYATPATGDGCRGHAPPSEPSPLIVPSGGVPPVPPHEDEGSGNPRRAGHPHELAHGPLEGGVAGDDPSQGLDAVHGLSGPQMEERLEGDCRGPPAQRDGRHGRVWQLGDGERRRESALGHVEGLRGTREGTCGLPVEPGDQEPARRHERNEQQGEHGRRQREAARLRLRTDDGPKPRDLAERAHDVNVPRRINAPSTRRPRGGLSATGYWLAVSASQLSIASPSAGRLSAPFSRTRSWNSAMENASPSVASAFARNREISSCPSL